MQDNMNVAIKPKAIRLKAVAYRSTEMAFKAYEKDQQILVNVHSHAQELNQVKCDQSTPKLHQNPTVLNNKNLRPSSSYVTESKRTKDRKASDGYVWRKYGQKLPRGSEFPRGYYRCTHPACPVKKIVDISKDGEISEIIYRGDHSHPKPPSSRLRNKAFVPDGNPPINEVNIFEIGTELFIVDGHDSHIDNSSVSVSFSTDSRVKATEFITMDDYVTINQKRKNDDNSRNSVAAAKSGPIPKLMGSIEYNDANNDGYNWRKYGHKVVKGRTYPRNYYRCSDQSCSARKYVDTASDDSGLFITTYKGEHSHE